MGLAEIDHLMVMRITFEAVIMWPNVDVQRCKSCYFWERNRIIGELPRTLRNMCRTNTTHTSHSASHTPHTRHIQYTHTHSHMYTDKFPHAHTHACAHTKNTALRTLSAQLLKLCQKLQSPWRPTLENCASNLDNSHKKLERLSS